MLFGGGGARGGGGKFIVGGLDLSTTPKVVAVDETRTRGSSLLRALATALMEDIALSIDSLRSPGDERARTSLTVAGVGDNDPFGIELSWPEGLAGGGGSINWN